MAYPIVLSYVQVEPILAARQKGLTSVEVSPDLGISRVNAVITSTGISFPSGEHLDWQQIEKIKQAQNNCFSVEDDTIKTISVFSEHTNRVCSLLPTRHAPSMLIAGFTMHRIVNTDPMQDTLKKVATIAPITGRVLDTATGLGYTSIEAAK